MYLVLGQGAAKRGHFPVASIAQCVGYLVSRTPIKPDTIGEVGGAHELVTFAVGAMTR